MTPAEKEARVIHQAYKDALVVLGGQVLQRALAQSAASGLAEATAINALTARMASLVYLYRAKARALAVAHSQLERALLTGFTFNDESNPFQSTPTLGDLRERFYARLSEFGIARPLRAVTHDPSVRVQPETIHGLQNLNRAIDGLLDAEIDNTVRKLGEDAIKKKLEGPDLALSDVGARLASGIERIALNGARDHDDNIIRLDRRVVKYTRVHDHAGDNPCGWCSMLMTRGFTGNSGFYLDQTAGGMDGHDGFHANCHCTVRKIYLPSQLDSDEFTLNREYARLWPQVTRGHSGKDMLRVWRKFIREREAMTSAAERAAA